jgi:hypothetical protein
MISKPMVSFRLINGDTFTGNLNQNNTSFHDGQYLYVNDDKYHGEINNGMKNGFGVYTYARTGEKY